MMKIYTSSYNLISKQQMNSRDDLRGMDGALLKFDFSDGSVGYADCLPWPIFGESPLGEHLRKLKLNQFTSLTKASFEIARWDAQARRKGAHLLKDLPFMENHSLLVSLSEFDEETLVGLEDFNLIKIKMGKNLNEESKALRYLLNSLNSVKKLRLDFNCSLSREEFVDWWGTVSHWLASFVDFVEDPFPYNGREWEKVRSEFGIRLALDWASDPLEEGGLGVDVVVLKPARQDIFGITENLLGRNPRLEFVLTHSMDHPLGRLSALARAAQWVRRFPDHCSIFGLGLDIEYEGLNFPQLMQMNKNRVEPISLGYGLGYQKVLESQVWKIL